MEGDGGLAAVSPKAYSRVDRVEWESAQTRSVWLEVDRMCPGAGWSVCRSRRLPAS